MQFFKLTVLSSCFLFLQLSLLAQDAVIKGKITDLKTKESLIGVNITTQNNNSSISDLNGAYELKLAEGNYTLTYSYVGYQDLTKTVELKANEILEIDINLEEVAKDLLGDELVITGSLFQKKASEEVISIEVIKPRLIQNTNATRIDEAFRRVSGVNVADGQANIRGGSGWAYGVGSRVGGVHEGTEPRATATR